MSRKRSPFKVGSLIDDRYKVVKKVGRGGFAVVYKASEKKLDRFVAIKVLVAKDDGSEDTQQRFVDEARKLAKISSQHVVTVHSNGIHDGVRYFVMEYLPYSLDKLLEDYQIGPDLANRILKQTLEGLAEVHDQGWTHRDIKPQNILLTNDDEVRLADFGIMKDPNVPRTEQGMNPGTPDWMAPEQRAGRLVSCSTDVYAFGLLAFRMISGQEWNDSNPVDLSQYTDTGTARLISQCLERRPSRRPAHARSVLQEWARIEEKVRKKQPRPPIRGDALVRNVKSRIENEYGLPSGSVKLVYPGSRRAVRADVTISKVREKWEA